MSTNLQIKSPTNEMGVFLWQTPTEVTLRLCKLPRLECAEKYLEWARAELELPVITDEVRKFAGECAWMDYEETERCAIVHRSLRPFAGKWWAVYQYLDHEARVWQAMDAGYTFFAL